MSKLNKKEFKELLVEWKNNFINEKTVPSLKGYIKAPAQDFVIIQVEDIKPKFIEELKKNNILFAFVGNIIIQCEKDGSDIKEFILRNFVLDEENKSLLESCYNESSPILVTSATFSGDFGEGQKHSKEDCFYWLIHDLFHANFDHGRLGMYGFLDSVNKETAEKITRKYKNLFPNLNYDFKDFDLDNLMDHNEEFISDTYSYEQGKKHEHIIPQLVAYFKSINFTDGFESFDLIPSIFSYCLIKMPSPDDISSLETMFNTLNLSDEAKMYLLIFNIVAKKKFNEIIRPMFIDKVLFLDLN